MRGIVTALILEALVIWQAFWAARILWGAQGTVPLLAFVGGLLAIAGSLAYLSQSAPSLDERMEENQKAHHLQEPPSNGHSPYSRTYPRTARSRR